MSKRWSSDYVVTEHRDLQASAMAVDATGSYVLLAGRRCFAVKQLSENSENIRKFPRQSKYEVGSAEWNPTLPNCHLCAISSNTRVEILSLANGGGHELQTTHSLRAHTRVVSDLNWHPRDPDLLASCSIDTFIHIWDLRDQRRPALSLSAVAGSSQVRWNPLSTYSLATAHDGDVKIWDQRKGNSPVQYIAAHVTKIHGLDWCPFQQNHLATSSQDCTVKIFDITTPRRAESTLTTNSPVWRARYTPFGEGLVTIVVPQLRRGENSLLLWNTSNFSAPIYTFVGHTDVVLEFQWRHQKGDNNDYELITWSKDQCLRIFKIDPFLKKLCGYDVEEPQFAEEQNPEPVADAEAEEEVSSMNKPDGLAVINDVVVEAEKEIPSPTQPKTLQQEFSLINMNIPNIELNAMDAVERSCTVTARNKNYNVILKVNFPSNYPCSAQPTFQFCPGTTVDNTIMSKLLKVLKQTAQQRVRKNRSCLEPCLRQLITTLEQTCNNDQSEVNHMSYIQTNNDFLSSSNICSNYQDTYIPFPRTSGAKFCGVSTLVCFGRSTFSRRGSVKPEGVTPRALSALASGMGGGPFMNMYAGSFGPSGDTMSISSFYFQERQKNIRRNNSSRGHSRNCYKNFYSVVTIYDASSIFFVNRELAEKYVLNLHDIPAMCKHNANVAASLERPDLVQAWCLAALVLTPPLPSNSPASCNIDVIPPWHTHPLGPNLLHSLIEHYANQSDVQMAGMLSCAYSQRSESREIPQNHQSKSVNASPGGSPYHTIHPADTSMEGWNFPNLKQNRSNSWSDLMNELKVSPTDASTDSIKPVRILDENVLLYDSYKKAYAEVLHRWRLLDQRAEVLKHVSAAYQDTSSDVKFENDCHECKKNYKGPQCTGCKKLTFECAICRISVRGTSSFCLLCGHGGHTKHLTNWFSKETVCPSGCGCNCLQAGSPDWSFFEKL